MTRLTAEDLRRSTLARQFPTVSGSPAQAAIALLDQIGPIQSQVPRAPFLAVASRLPGTSYATVCELFESFQLLKTSNLRGTVHTSTRRDFGWLDAVATETRRPALKNALKLTKTTPEQVRAEVRRFCDGHWRPRTEIVEHVRGWLVEHESAASAHLLTGTFSESIIWGNSGLLRRPKDAAWEKRTDTFHRTAATLVTGLVDATPGDALVELVRRQLGAYGPLTRRDLSFFFGTGLGQVDAALSRLGEEVVPIVGPDGESLVDLAEPPTGGDGDPGLKLLGEFDGLLLGFCGPNRTRFLDPADLAKVWSKANGIFHPVVLYDGRLVATWRTVAAGKLTALEVTMLAPDQRLTEGLFADAVADLTAVLPVVIDDVRVR